MSLSAFINPNFTLTLIFDVG